MGEMGPIDFRPLVYVGIMLGVAVTVVLVTFMVLVVWLL